MSTLPNIDPGTLGWVKSEIETTFERARHALDGYAADRSDVNSLRLFGSYLHQVFGTLKMVELDAAASVAQEAEMLADDAVDGGPGDTDVVAEVLRRSLDDLSVYLARLQSYPPPTPLALVPAINRLRTAHGQAETSQLELFTPDLSVRPPEVRMKDALQPGLFLKVAADLRRRYQRALLAWLKSPDDRAALAGFERVFANLRVVDRRGSLRQLWWVAGGLVEAMQAGGVPADARSKHVLARIDEQFRHILAADQQGVAREAPDELIREMLLLIGRSGHDGPQCSEIRKAFGLDAWLGDGGADLVPDVEASAAALAAFGESAGPGLDRIQHLLARCSGPDRDEPEAGDELRAVVDRLAADARAATLGVLNELIDEFAHAVADLVSGRAADRDTVAVSLTGALLFIHDSLQGKYRPGVDWTGEGRASIHELRARRGPASPPAIPEEDGDDARSPDRDVGIGRTTTIAVDNVRLEVRQIEQILESFAEQPEEPARLGAAGESLRRIADAFQSLGAGSAVVLARRVGDAFAEVEGGRFGGSPRVIDALAMGIGSLLAYGEEVAGGGGDPERIVERANRELDESFPRSAQRARAEGEGVRDNGVGGVAAAIEESPGDDAGVPWETIDLAAAADLPGFDDEDDLDAETAPAAEVGPAGTASQAGIGLGPGPAGDGEDLAIDDLFHSEARDLMDEAARLNAAWRNDPGSRPVLTELRRCFHTFKGSARFAERTVLSELAWYTEDLLNKVLGGTIGPSVEIYDYVDDSRNLLESLLRGDSRAEEIDLDAWQDRAAHAGIAPFPGPSSATVGDEPEPFLQVVDEDDAAGLEFDVMSVFRAEVRSILGVLEAGAAAALQPGGVAVSDDMLRTTHTLIGVCRSVGLLAAGSLAETLDRYLRQGRYHGRPLDADDGRLFERVVAIVRDLTGATEAPLAGCDALQADIEARLAGVAGTASGEPPPAVSVGDADAQLSARDWRHDDELLDVFREEAADILERMDESLEAWRQGADATVILPSLRRELHTFKGGARAAGVHTLAELSHGAESLLDDLDPTALDDGGELRALLRDTRDLLSAITTDPAAGFTGAVERLRQRLDAFAGRVRTGAADRRVAAADDGREPAATGVPWATLPGEAIEGTEARQYVRVQTATLDELVNYAGEVSIIRTRLQQQLTGVRNSLRELNDNISVFRQQLRELEIETEAQMLSRSDGAGGDGAANLDFDPLELDRFSRMQVLARGLADRLDALVAVQAGINEFAGDADGTLQQQAHVSRGLQDGLLRVRMVSFAGFVPRLRYIARQTARELGKEVELDVIGGHIEMDRKVLEQMMAPFEHMIRNAVHHGIEDAQERLRLGKSATGRLTIACRQEGSEAVLEVSDDGAGLDIERIAEVAVARGLVDNIEAVQPSDMMRLLATPGLSTARELSFVSGRGVGMDVVTDVVKRLGGSISVSSAPGEGTTFTLRLPVNLAIGHALLVYAGDQMFAIPARGIGSVLRLPADRIRTGAAGGRVIDVQGEEIPVMNLAARLDIAREGRTEEVVPVVVMHIGTVTIGVEVNDLGDTREIVVKPPGPLLEDIAGIAGATILGDGSVVLILDVAELWQTRHDEIVPDRDPDEGRRESEPGTVMVVDDSLTVRSVMGRDLQTAGFEVILAKDGVDAVEQLRYVIPDVMLVDLEMPRMDGFELIGRIRGSTETAHIPIIVITSRSGQRHRDRALEAGASDYVTKPYQIDRLVQQIHDLGAGATTAGRAGATSASAPPPGG